MCLAQITSSEIAAHGYAGLHYLLPRANPNSLWSRSCMGGVADKSCKLPFLIMLEEEGAIEYHSIRNQRMSKVHTRWVTYLAGDPPTAVRAGTLRPQPGACPHSAAPPLERRPGEEGKKTPGPRPPPARSGPKPRRRPRAGRAPALGPPEPSPPRGRGAPAQPAHLLRLLPQRDAHGPEARLQLGNVHPAVLVEVQLSEEVGVAGVAIPVPVAGGRRQEEGSQQLEHVGPGQTRSVRDSAGWARIRHRPGCCQRPQLPGEGRGGERRALPARQREGGRGAAGLAPPVPPPRWAGHRGRERAAAAPRAPHSSCSRLRACSSSTFPAQAQKYHKRCERPSFDT